MTLKHTFSKIRPLALLLAACVGQGGVMPSIAHAQGADGVDLEIVPMNTGEECSSIILKGTNRFQGTAFVMPRVVVGMTKESENLFEIEPDGPGKYLMTIGLYFPGTQDAVALRAANSELYLQGCNFEAALHSINQGVTDATKKVDRLARLPVSGIEVVVDGIEEHGYIGNRGDKVGSGATTILNYEGTDQTVEFEITQSEKDALMRRLERKQGLSIMVNVNFAARSNDGALYADVDLDDVANRLDASLVGSYMVAEATLGTAISKSLSSANVRIQTEAGTSASFDKISQTLIALVTSAVPSAALGEQPDLSAPGTAPVNPVPHPVVPVGPTPVPATPIIPLPTTPAPGSTPLPVPGATPAPTLPIGVHPIQPIQPIIPLSADLGTLTPVATAPTSAVAEASPVSFKVSAVVSYLHSQHHRTISYDNKSALETHVFSTPINFQARMLDPDVQELYVRAGENADLLPDMIRKGDQITIGVQSASVENIQYNSKAKYLTSNELQSLHVLQMFPLIQDDRFVISNQDTKMGYVAVGKLTEKTMFGWTGIGNPTRDLPGRYFWTRTQLVPDYSHRVTQQVPSNLDALKGLALQVNFSKIGIRNFQLANLVQDNAYWTASYDDFGGQIQLTAKRDLGYMAISSAAYPVTQSMTVDRITQELRTDGVQPIMQSPDAGTRTTQLPIKRNAYLLDIGRPSDNTGVQSVSPTAPPVPGRVAPITGVTPPVSSGSAE